jgi:2'-5' RNA ligase
LVGANEQTRRLFVAVPLPQRSIPFAVSAQGLLPLSSGLRLVPREQLHCTVAFIGQADSKKTEAAKCAVEDIPADSGGDALINGFVFLPGLRKARVVALRVEDDSGVLGLLFEEVMGRLEAAGVMRREKRPFRAHVTVARLKGTGMVQPTFDCGREAFGVESVCLYESELSRSGAVHKLLVQKDLQRAHGPKRA